MKILIIDDEPLVRRSLNKVLTARQHQVFEASDGLQGLSLWKEQKPDLVFVDVLMPGMKGPEVIKAASPHSSAKVILMTAFSGDESLNAESTSADLFLKKPFENIFEIVQQAEELLK